MKRTHLALASEQLAPQLHVYVPSSTRKFHMPLWTPGLFGPYVALDCFEMRTGQLFSLPAHKGNLVTTLPVYPSLSPRRRSPLSLHDAALLSLSLPRRHSSLSSISPSPSLPRRRSSFSSLSLFSPPLLSLISLRHSSLPPHFLPGNSCLRLQMRYLFFTDLIFLLN